MKDNFLRIDGLGNTFVVSNGPKVIEINEVRQLCASQQTGGLLIVEPVTNNIVKMKYWNADGSASEMCENGLRCLARFAVDEFMVSPGTFTVQTDAGELQVKCYKQKR